MSISVIIIKITHASLTRFVSFTHMKSDIFWYFASCGEGVPEIMRIPTTIWTSVCHSDRRERRTTWRRLIQFHRYKGSCEVNKEGKDTLSILFRSWRGTNSVRLVWLIIFHTNSSFRTVLQAPPIRFSRDFPSSPFSLSTLPHFCHNVVDTAAISLLNQVLLAEVV